MSMQLFGELPTISYTGNDYRLEFWETAYTSDSSLYSWNAYRKIHRNAQDMHSMHRKMHCIISRVFGLGRPIFFQSHGAQFLFLFGGWSIILLFFIDFNFSDMTRLISCML
jgi:hypothetical protein